MRYAVLAAGILLTATGALSFALPARLRDILAWFATANRLALAVLGRLALGLVLLLGAQSTRWPAACIALGLAFLAAGAVIPVLGEARVERLVRWWLARPDAALRAWSAVVTVIGAFIASLAA